MFRVQKYENLWIALPLGLLPISGLIGVACGAVAVACNIALMRRRRMGQLRYVLAGMVTAGAVVGSILGAKLFLSVTGLEVRMQAAQLDKALAATPAAVVIRTADPLAYARLRAAMLDASHHHRSGAAESALLHAAVVAELVRFRPHAADLAVLQAAQVLTLEIEQLGDKSADACYGFLFPAPGAPAVVMQNFVTAEVLKADAATTLRVISSGAADPHSVPERTVVTPALQQVGHDMVARFGDGALAALAYPQRIPHATACRLVGALYEDVLRLPPGQAIPLLRFLFAASSGA